jgi:uncharacterized protein
MLKNKKIIFVCLLGVCVFIYCLPFRPVLIEKKLILIKVADNAEERTQGLKGISSLAKNTGMLFCFEKEGYPQFWMKDTLVALDIAFIDRNKRIIDIQQMDVIDDEKLRYMPSNKAKYALEMNLGWFASNDISIGDKLVFWE